MGGLRLGDVEAGFFEASGEIHADVEAGREGLIGVIGLEVLVGV